MGEVPFMVRLNSYRPVDGPVRAMAPFSTIRSICWKRRYMSRCLSVESCYSDYEVEGPREIQHIFTHLELQTPRYVYLSCLVTSFHT